MACPHSCLQYAVAWYVASSLNLDGMLSYLGLQLFTLTSADATKYETSPQDKLYCIVKDCGI